MKKVILGGFAGLIAITMVTGSITEPIIVYAKDKEKDEALKELEKEKRKLEQRKKDAVKNKKKMEEKIKKNKKNQKELVKEIEEIDEKLTETKEQINLREKEIEEAEKRVDELLDEIKVLQKEIIKLNKQIAEVQERIDRRSEILGNRLNSIQKNGDISYLEVLFGSKSFSEFISRFSAIKTIVNQDQKILTEQIKDKQLIEESKRIVEDNKSLIEYQKRELEEKEATLKEEKKELIKLQKELDKKSKEKEKLLEKLKEEHEELTSEHLSAEEEQSILKSQTEIVEKAIEQYKKNPDALIHYSANEGNGILLQPAIGRLTSKFGMRIHPITGERKMHRGMDIAAPTGTPVLASGSGTVTHASYTGGYGNVIFIYHPHLNLTTVYAHLSKIHVKPGQTVEVGERIGDIGSTGQSTGPHLHFEVHVGQYNKANAVDPQIYLK